MGDANAFVEENLRLAYMLVHRFHALHGHSVEDLASEAMWGLVNGSQTYDMESGAQTTWAYNWVYWRLWYYCHPKEVHRMTKESLYHTSEESLEEERFESRPRWAHALMKDLGEEGKELIRIILSAPEELIDEYRNVKKEASRLRLVRKVRAYLINELDWSNAKVDRAWQEVVTCL